MTRNADHEGIVPFDYGDGVNRPNWSPNADTGRRYGGVTLVDYTRCPLADANDCGIRGWMVRADGKDGWLCGEFVCPIRDASHIGSSETP